MVQHRVGLVYLKESLQHYPGRIEGQGVYFYSFRTPQNNPLERTGAIEAHPRESLSRASEGDVRSVKTQFAGACRASALQANTP